MPPADSSTAPLGVLYASPECAPLVKIGGLGDVTAALPPALREAGLDARVLLPGYTSVLDALPDAVEAAQLRALGHDVRLLEATLPSGVPVIVVACKQLYARGGGPYQADDGEDWEDNALRFALFSRVAAILASEASPLAWRPDVLHCNDWPTSLAPMYLAFTPGRRAATMVTIHNLAFQGRFEYDQVEGLEIPAAALGTDGLEFYGRVSMLKGALVYSDAITTVSPTYAQEIQGPELGFGLEGVLKERHDALFGVLNGIDTNLWNPLTDPHIARTYGVLTLERKLANKRALKKRLQLSGPDEVAVLGVVSRITHQKGIDVIANAIPRLARNVQLVVVGAGEREMVEQLRAGALALPLAGGAAHRVQRAARAPGRGRRRRLPHVLALRALRNEPDVQPALRHPAHRERDRRAARHHRRRCDRGYARGDGLPHPGARRGGAGARRGARAGRPRQRAALEEDADHRDDARLRLGAGREGLREDLRAHQAHFMSPISKRCASAAWNGYARMRSSSLPHSSGASSSA